MVMFFFFQAEDGIRDDLVTGVQTCALPISQVPRHLNGAVQSGIATAMPSTQLFASPLRFDDQWKPQPYLAESWKLAEDGKSLTLNLRRNAVFHDGKPITSADVAFSIMAIKANHPFQTDRKSTRLNSSHQIISYAVFCLKKKKKLYQYHEKSPPHQKQHQ